MRRPSGGRRLARGAAILVAAGAVLGLGHRYTPVPEAEASVFQDLGAEMAGVPPFLEFRVPADKVQPAVFNGGRVYYTRTQVDRRISDILDFYEDLYALPAADVIHPDRLKGLKGKERERFRFLLDHLPEANRLMSRGVLRRQNATTGMLSAVRTGQEGQPGAALDFVKRATTFARTGRIGDLGEVKVVYAMKPSLGPATVFTFWPDPSFNMASLKAPEEGDAPGGDIPGIERPADAQRLLSFGQDMPGLALRIASYESDEGRDAAVDGWAERLAAAGWSEAKGMRQRSADAAEATSLYFQRAGQDAYVQVREDGQGDRTLSTAYVTLRAAPAR